MDKLDKKLLELTKRIEETREILNEACITFQDEKKTLHISQYLDDLIVEYIKVLSTTSENINNSSKIG
ncbi:aspartyl-phosphate phosphatase Spo0E family protein [Clostridium sp.]|uniref:aspartyl-phosphate phosphatase Spo0E family protein n=1 Tax=Clostridium sp. TaxID=1506 RepID=UPI002FC68A1F